MEIIYKDLLGCLFTRMSIMTEYFDPLLQNYKNMHKEQQILLKKYYKEIDSLFLDNYNIDCNDISKSLGFNYDDVHKYSYNLLLKNKI